MFETEVNMFHPQSGFYPQNFYPQSNFYPQANFGAQGTPFVGLHSSPNNIFNVPFANTQYGQSQFGQYAYPQQTPAFIPGLSQSPAWQYPAQQAALQQHAIQQLLAHQLAAQQFAMRQPPGGNGLNGLANGTTQPGAAWQPQQLGPEQGNQAVLLHQQHLLQQLAQYHNLVAQQLAQLAAQQAVQSSGNPYAAQFMPGQFIPGQLGANFVPGVTMH
jgi:hypothetical protein